MGMYVETDQRWPGGKRAHIGDKVTVTTTSEPAFLRVFGVNGFVTVWHPTWDKARVVQMDDIEPR